jgi:hypothetical protein
VFSEWVCEKALIVAKTVLAPGRVIGSLTYFLRSWFLHWI